VQSTVAGDYGVGTELAGIAGWPPEPPPSAHEARVRGDRSRRPDVTDRAASDSEQAVELSIHVGQNRELNIEMPVVGRKL